MSISSSSHSLGGGSGGAGGGPVPNRFSDDEWFAVLDMEEGHACVERIVQSVVANVGELIERRQIERSTVGFSLDAGKEIIDFFFNVLLYFFELSIRILRGTRIAQRCSKQNLSLVRLR
jgi:hypothetical protein